MAGFDLPDADDLKKLAEQLPDMGGLSPLESALLAEGVAMDGSEAGKEAEAMMEKMGLKPALWADEDIAALIALAPVTGTYYKLEKARATKPNDQETLDALNVQIVELGKRYAGGDADTLSAIWGEVD